MIRHLARKQPKPGRRFSWGRWVPEDQTGVVYRLFRRDMTRHLHMTERRYYRDAPRDVIARELSRARNELRDAVDERDFKLLGLAA